MFSPAVTSFFQLTPSFQSFPLKLTGISLNARDNMCYSTNVFPHTAAAAAVAVAVAAYTSLNPFHSSKLNRGNTKFLMPSMGPLCNYTGILNVKMSSTKSDQNKRVKNI